MLKPGKTLAPHLVSLTTALLLQFATTSAQAADGYKRLDMRIEGASCAACLIRLEKKFKNMPGVRRAMVSIYKPYNAILVYDPSITTSDIKKVLATENARAAALKESSVATLPLVLAPR